MGIGDDAEEGAGAGEAGAVVEEGVVGGDGADAAEDGVVEVADGLDVGAGGFGGDPAGVILGGGDFAIKSDGGLERDQRAAGAHEVEEAHVEFLGFGLEARVNDDFDAGVAKEGEAASGDGGVGIFGDGDDAGDAGFDEGVGAGAGAAGVGAGFEVDVEGGATCGGTGLLDREDFGVFDAGPGVEAAAGDLAALNENGADGGVG